MSQDILENSVTSQPSSGDKNFKPFEASAEIEALADERIAHYPVSKLSAVLPLLHIVQHHFGFISKESITWVAEKLEIEKIKVLSVVTFYPAFRQSAPGKFHYRVCRTLSCAMAGSHELMDKICEITNIDRSKLSHHHPIVVSPCGNYSVEFAECLASCGSAPACLVNDDFHDNVGPEKAQALIDQYSV
ncbi:complex I 24 kDa subunit family protein [Rubritalea profundi]|uniref:NADH-quinone oxidoreductase subunit NuoE family protein n=1 Tax=Rubritalea profundi TaxID=1658618 RepID=UPI000CF57B99|nr:NAD(P)H-dependent oxidoreductase subunit E [Rubritalea profundi]